MSETDFETALRYLKAMAHENRLRLLGIVAAGLMQRDSGIYWRITP